MAKGPRTGGKGLSWAGGGNFILERMEEDARGGQSLEDLQTGERILPNGLIFLIKREAKPSARGWRAVTGTGQAACGKGAGVASTGQCPAC